MNENRNGLRPVGRDAAAPTRRQDAGPSEREIERLIEAAGPRPPVPAEDMRRIVAAARAEWRASVETRRGGVSRWIPLAAAAALLVALGSGWWWMTNRPPQAVAALATVERVVGEVRATEDGGDVPLAVGAELAAGARVTTVSDPAPGRAALRLAGGQSLRLDGGTSLRLLTDSSIELTRGAVYVDSGLGAEHRWIEVKTAFGSVRDVGTQFEVRLDSDAPRLRVRVRQGEVEILRDAEVHPVSAGEERTLGADGSLTRGRLEAYAPEWDWVVGAAPGRSLDGMTLEEVLGWVERETGLAARFADQELAATMLTVSVYGPTLPPSEALDTALTGSGLAYRIEDGTLWIHRAGS